MKALIVSIALLALPALAEEKLDIQVSPEIAAKCEAEGGCLLVSRANFEKALKEVFNSGKEEGQKQADKDNKFCDRHSL